MKLYLASYWESKNHGPGRLMSIAWTKPDYFSSDGVYETFAPSKEIIHEYEKTKLDDPIKAQEDFKNNYKAQLHETVEDIKKDAKDTGLPVHKLLQLMHGDTFLSWERESYTNYRKILAEYLLELGFDVEVH